MQDGRRGLINRVDLLLRLIEWQAQSRGEMERQIVGKNNERGEGESGTEGGWEGGREGAGEEWLVMCAPDVIIF